MTNNSFALRALENFCADPSYHKWQALSPEVSSQLKEVATYAKRHRKGKTSMVELVLRYTRIPRGSVFSQSSTALRDVTKTGVFSNRLYFPEGAENIEVYNKTTDQKAMTLVHTIIPELLGVWVYPIPFQNQTKEEREDVRDKFSQYITRCTKEILYDKIRSSYNFVYSPRLTCLVGACLVVAAKVILQHDALYGGNLTKWVSEQLGCDAETMVRMEMDILSTTNYQGCFETRRRLGDAINPCAL
jgi:hypothetical protein